MEGNNEAMINELRNSITMIRITMMVIKFLQRERLLQGAERFVDQLRPIVERHDGELALGAIGQYFGG